MATSAVINLPTQKSPIESHSGSFAETLANSIYMAVNRGKVEKANRMANSDQLKVSDYSHSMPNSDHQPASASSSKSTPCDASGKDSQSGSSISLTSSEHLTSDSPDTKAPATEASTSWISTRIIVLVSLVLNAFGIVAFNYFVSICTGLTCYHDAMEMAIGLAASFLTLYLAMLATVGSPWSHIIGKLEKKQEEKASTESSEKEAAKQKMENNWNRACKGKKIGKSWKRVTKWQSKMATLVLYSLAIICMLSGTCEAKVKITAIKVPRAVENGTQPSVVLDCPFTHDPKRDIRLVVKWFFNEEAEPIYQWITEFGTRIVPQRYEGKVNPNYASSNTNDPMQKHRALNLIRPTVELNGRYSCHVISIMSQDSAEATMIVYAKTKSIDLSTRRVMKERSTALQQTNRQPGHSPTHQQPQSDSSSSWSSSAAAAGLSSSWLLGSDNTYNGQPSSLNSPTTTEIECAVQNVYPLPELTIYQVLKDGLRPKSLVNARLAQNVTQLANGAFCVSVTAYIEDNALFPPSGDPNGRNGQQQQSGLGSSTIFECLVAQDEIRHELRKRTLYTPIEESDYDSSGATAEMGPTFKLMLFIMCMPLFIIFSAIY